MTIISKSAAGLFAAAALACTAAAAPTVVLAQSYDVGALGGAVRANAEQAREAQRLGIQAAARARFEGAGTVTFTGTGGDAYLGDGTYIDGAETRNGYGLQYWQDGEYYAGEFRANVATGGAKHGFGVYAFANGEVYEGQWQNDLRHGSGVQWNPDGTIYHAGMWRNGNPAY